MERVTVALGPTNSAAINRADAKIGGLSVAQAEARFPEARIFALRLRRGGVILEIEPDLRISAGDILAVGGRRGPIIAILGPNAAEVEDRELLDSPFLTAEILVTESAAVGKGLQTLADAPWARGIYMDSLRRGAQQLPLAADLVLERGDVVKLTGPQATVERGAKQIGAVIAPSTATDFIVLGFAIFLGGLAGALLRVNIAGIEVVLGTSVGALVAGLIVGHLRTRHPLFGRIPDGAVALMTSLGLAAFVAMTGLHAGPVFVPALKDAGLGLLVGGIVVTMVPLFVGLGFGHWVLRMNPVLLLGGLAGALTMTAAMAAVQTRADSPVAVLGYTPAYPVGQILLTVWGSLIVILMA